MTTSIGVIDSVRGTLTVLTVCAALRVAGRGLDERRWYDHCSIREVVRVMWDRRDWVCCGCGVVPQSAEQVCREVEAADAASVARLVRVDARNTRGGYVCSVHVYVGLVVAWSGGCGSWSAAKSSGAHQWAIVVTRVK